MDLHLQIIWLFILPVPVACITWTITQEEIFREPRDYCKKMCAQENSFLKRKFFYPFTCEYCFSHYVTILFLILTEYKLLLPGWKGYIIAGFAVVWIANIYMNVYAFIRQEIKKEKTEIKVLEKETMEK